MTTWCKKHKMFLQCSHDEKWKAEAQSLSSFIYSIAGMHPIFESHDS